MSVLPAALPVPFPHARRWLRLWLITLNVGLLVVALILGVAVSRRAFFLVLVVPLGVTPFAYARLRLHDELARALARSPRVLAAVAGAGVLLDFILVAQLVTGRSADGLPLLHGPGVGWIGPVWFSAHALLFLGYAIIGAGRLPRRLLLRAWSRVAPERSDAAAATLESPARRELLQHAGLVGAAMPFFISLSGVELSYDLRVEQHEIELPRWPRALDGLRVAHLSDIHVGGGMTRERLQHMADLTNQERPDLILYTGDFLTHRSGDYDRPLYEALTRIRAPYGQWACLGNHDYDDVARFARRLQGAGVELLRDRLARVDVAGTAVEIVGTNFQFARESHQEIFASLFAQLPPRSAAPRLLLNHDPRNFFSIPDDCTDLMLSGHTHGGHVGVQLSKDHAITVVSLVGIPDQGVFVRGDMRMFVTRCVGFYGYPMRVGIPPEIALLTLRAPAHPTTSA